MRRLLTACLLATTTLGLSAQSAAPAPDPLDALHFLLGTWTAKTTAPDGSADFHSYLEWSGARQ